MFLELGEKLGAISHIVSFWRYRFPPGSPPHIDAEELTAIFQDFSSGFGEKIQGEASLIKQPHGHRHHRRLTQPQGLTTKDYNPTT